MWSTLVKVDKGLKIGQFCLQSCLKDKWHSCYHGPAKHISVVLCLCWVWLTVVTLCLVQVSLEMHLLTGLKPKSSSVCWNGIPLCKSCVLQTEAHFTEMLPVIVQLHPKPCIENKPKKSETKAWLPAFLKTIKPEPNKQKNTPLYLALFRRVSVFFNCFVFCIPLTSCFQSW